MKTVLCLFALFALTFARPDEVKYTDKYDSVDLKELLNNHRLLLGYIKCVLDQGKCTTDALELKSHIKEAMENNCGKCTETQKRGTKTVIAHLINNEKEFWDQLVAKYDPEHKYTTKYEKELKTITA